jgi:hypothetical protein
MGAQLTDDRDYQVALARQQELAARVRELDSAVQRSGVEFTPAASPRDALDRAAEQLAKPGGRYSPAEALQGVKNETLEALSREREVVRRALALARKRVEDLTEELSCRECRELAPRYRSIGGRICDALKELTAAADAERAFRDDLEARGYRFDMTVLPPMALPWATSNENRSGRIFAYLDAARKAGLID